MIEENPIKFLDTEIVRHNSPIITKVYTRSNKFIHWSSRFPWKYKRNTITGELNRAINEIKQIFTSRFPNSYHK